MELNLDKIRAGFDSLQSAKEKSLRTRFRFDASPEDVAAHLRQFYLLEVRGRGRELTALDEFTNLKIGQAAQWLTISKKPGLFLCGHVGTGKTTLARAIVGLVGAAGASNVSSERRYIAVATAKELAEMKGETYAPGTISPEVFFDNRKHAKMLFIDDLGTEPVVTKKWGNEQTPVIDVLFYRYDQQLFTIITSNLDSPEAIRERYGPRIVDRFYEMFDFVGYDRASYRR